MNLTIHVMTCCVFIIAIELSPTKHKTKFLSHGDSIFLPCTVNASNNVYPVPNSVEWWKDDSQLEDGVR